jgi:hypothetical protein
MSGGGKLGTTRERLPDEGSLADSFSNVHGIMHTNDLDAQSSALPTLQAKVARAERQARARMQEDEQDGDDAYQEEQSELDGQQSHLLSEGVGEVRHPQTPQFAGWQSASKEEADIFGPDPFPPQSPAAQPQTLSTSSPQTPVLSAAPPPATTGSANPSTSSEVPLTEEETIATSPMLDAQFYRATDNLVNQLTASAFQMVQSDPIGEAAQQADQLTASFSAENASAAAGLLDSTEQAQTGKLLDSNSAASPNTAQPAAATNAIPPVLDTNVFVPDVGLPEHLDPLVSAPGMPSLGAGLGFQFSNQALGTGSPSQTSVAQPQTLSNGKDEPQSEKPAVCPKCGADLHGQFSFCLSCLAIL